MDLGCGWKPMDVLIFFGCWVVEREREREKEREWRRKQIDGEKEGDEINYFMG